MPLVRRTKAKQRPLAELQMIGDWLCGDVVADDNEEAARARAECYFVDLLELRQLWAELRRTLLPLWLSDRERFVEGRGSPADAMAMHHVFSVADVCELWGSEKAEEYAIFHQEPEEQSLSYRNYPTVP